MSDFIKSENSELLIELSEQQQEAVAGGGGVVLPGFELPGFELIGFDHLFFQQTEIRTFANKQLSISLNGTAVSSESTGYELSQTTLELGSPIFSRGKQHHHHHHHHHR